MRSMARDGAARQVIFQRGYGATVARLTPDQKVGSSNLSALTLCKNAGDSDDVRQWRNIVWPVNVAAH